MRCAAEDVGAPGDLESNQSRRHDRGVELGVEQSSNDSTLPDIDVAFGTLRYGLGHKDVADLLAPPGPEHARHFAQPPVLSGRRLITLLEMTTSANSPLTGSRETLLRVAEESCEWSPGMEVKAACGLVCDQRVLGLDLVPERITVELRIRPGRHGYLPHAVRHVPLRAGRRDGPGPRPLVNCRTSNTPLFYGLLD